MTMPGISTLPTMPTMPTISTLPTASNPSTASTGGANARSRRTWRRISVAFLLAATVLIVDGAAIAQEFVKVDDAAREQLPATPFVGVAYGFIWVAILGYLFVVARGLGRLQGELRDLRRRIDRASGDGPRTG